LKKLLIYTDYYKQPTGYGRIAKTVLPELKKHFQIGYMPQNTTVFDTEYEYVKDMQSFNPDIVLTIQNWELISKLDIPFCHVNWCCIENEPFPEQWRLLLTQVDKLIPMTEFCQLVFKKAIPFHSKIVEPIMPPVDTVFHEMSFTELSGMNNPYKDKKIILCVAKNESRKNLHALIAAFGIINNTYPDKYHLQIIQLPVKLDNTHIPWNLDMIADQYGIGTSMTYNTSTQPLEDSILNYLYNVSSCVVLSSQSEGIGMPLLEAASVGTPCVAVGYSGAAEIARKYGRVVEDYTPFWDADGRKYAFVKPEHLAHGIIMACEMKVDKRPENNIDRLIEEIDSTRKVDNKYGINMYPILARQLSGDIYTRV